MTTNNLTSKTLTILALANCGIMAAQKNSKPNVIVILADDLGYGDVGAYGSHTIQTPSIDRLANNGLKFTQGFATSATSTPSRYAMFTGLYPWADGRHVSILPGDAPMAIKQDQSTMPKMFQQAGYTTGAVGKWHLGLGDGSINWNSKVYPGVNEVGFDYTYMMGATNDRVPCIYLENGVVDNLDSKDPIDVNYRKNFPGEPTGRKNPELLKMFTSQGHDCSIVNGISRIGYMKGGKKALWKDETMAFVFLDKVKQFIATNQETPFFLYYGLNEPHVPRAPNERFVGKSGLGPRGDAILEADYMIGELQNYLKELDLLENTIIIFSSDNGPVLDDGYVDFANEMIGSHRPWGNLRGGKYSLYEAGTRVPFIVSWPKKIKKGTTSNALISQMDFYASFAKMLEQPLPEGLDSKDFFKVLIGKTKKGRESMILEACGRIMMKAGDYAFIPPYKGRFFRNSTKTESGASSNYQLYNIVKDPGERKNLATIEKKKLEEMKLLFKQLTKNRYGKK